MQGPEDDPGLAGKVTLVSGGGAAGDGIGNGRAAAILLARAGARVLVADAISSSPNVTRQAPERVSQEH
jgi:NAD(P)-dependent dehydrogenase (short-subunit alcohol dehydrogenase family)